MWQPIVNNSNKWDYDLVLLQLSVFAVFPGGMEEIFENIGYCGVKPISFVIYSIRVTIWIQCAFLVNHSSISCETVCLTGAREWEEETGGRTERGEKFFLITFNCSGRRNWMSTKHKWCGGDNARRECDVMEKYRKLENYENSSIQAGDIKFSDLLRS